MPEPTRSLCPHCGAPLARLELPDIFDHPYDLACFNDLCSYYVRGWTWMEQQFGVKSSYRYRVDGRSGFASPIAVWSPTALRNCLASDDAAAAAGSRS